MNKKNDKKICWNCDGDVSVHLTQCPYCGVDVTKPSQNENRPFKEIGSPFQSSNAIPKPPYANLFSKEYGVSEEDWNKALDEEKAPKATTEKKHEPLTKKELLALFLILPGIVFFLFALVLVFFSHEGVLSVNWNQNLAYFYFIGSLPLLFFGWRIFN